ncbi:MAG TPA: hypothetical protein VGP82_16840 [Ktedonobacterales bacterium]|jgi:hypothetical protein|nr:hypothetical protein [Ktedonobacterales bacterium]
MSDATNPLVRYEAARAALAECVRIDEVKDIRDRAQALAAYAQQAHDQELQLCASELQHRAERRAGEMLTEMTITGQRRRQGRMKSLAGTSTLAELGISPNNCVRWRRLSMISQETFDAALAHARTTNKPASLASLLALVPVTPRASTLDKAARVARALKAEERRRKKAQAQVDHALMFTMHARMIVRHLKAHPPTYTDEEYQLADEIRALLPQHTETTA